MERMNFIISRLRTRANLTANDIKNELEICQRTLMRDIAYMKDRMLIPIEYDKERKSYILTGPVKSTPTIHIDDLDTQILFLARALVSQVGSEELGKCFDDILDRLSMVTGSCFRDKIDEGHRRFVADYTTGENVDIETWLLALRGIREGRLISLRVSPNAELQICEPQYYGVLEGQMYLIVCNTADTTLSVLPFGSFKIEEILDEKFDLTDDFIPEELIERLLQEAGEKKVKHVFETFKPVPRVEIDDSFLPSIAQKSGKPHETQDY